MPTQVDGFILTRQWIKAVGQDANAAAQQVINDIAATLVRNAEQHNPPQSQLSHSIVSNLSAATADNSSATESEIEDRAIRADMATADWFRDAYAFFEDRLAEAFRGVHGLQIYKGRDALARLETLLKSPLTIQRHHANQPIWWWSGRGNMSIDGFKVLDDVRLWCLMSRYELLINTVAVFRTNKSYRSFVYVSVDADQPTGVSGITPEQIHDDIQEYGFSTEYVGFWNGRYVKGEEYEDGFAELDGKVVKLSNAESRTRYLSAYNFFLATQASAFSASENDEAVDNLCQSLLKGKLTIAQAVDDIGALPFSGHFNSLRLWMD